MKILHLKPEVRLSDKTLLVLGFLALLICAVALGFIVEGLKP